MMSQVSSSPKEGLPLSEFRILIQSLQECEEFQRKMLKKIFGAFDTKGKGYITRDDFQAVSSAQYRNVLLLYRGTVAVAALDHIALPVRLREYVSEQVFCSTFEIFMHLATPVSLMAIHLRNTP